MVSSNDCACGLGFVADAASRACASAALFLRNRLFWLSLNFCGSGCWARVAAAPMTCLLMGRVDVGALLLRCWRGFDCGGDDDLGVFASVTARICCSTV